MLCTLQPCKEEEGKRGYFQALLVPYQQLPPAWSAVTHQGVLMVGLAIRSRRYLSKSPHMRGQAQQEPLGGH